MQYYITNTKVTYWCTILVQLTESLQLESHGLASEGRIDQLMVPESFQEMSPADRLHHHESSLNK